MASLAGPVCRPRRAKGYGWTKHFEPRPFAVCTRAASCCCSRLVGTRAATSAGLAWARGWPDGNAIPARVLEETVREIARVTPLPLSVDVEAGLSDDANAVGEAVARVIGAGAVGINLEDGAGPPDLLCAKLAAARRAALDEALARGQRYAAAGADGFFTPGLVELAPMRALSEGVALPLNVMWRPQLPSTRELRAHGVRRLSAGSALAQAALGSLRRDASAFLAGAPVDLATGAMTYGELNALFG